MEKRVRLFAVGLLFFAVGFARAQPAGFLGKRMAFTVGTSLNTPFIDLPSHGLLNDKSEDTVLPPKIGAGFEYVVHDHASAKAVVSYYSFPDSYFFIVNGSTVSNGSVTLIEADTFQLRSNMLSLNLESRVYMEFAPYSRYITFGVGGNVVRSRNQFTSYAYAEHDEDYPNERLIRFPETKHTTLLYNFFIGYGRQRILAEKYIIDYGLKAYVFQGQKKLGNEREDDFSFGFGPAQPEFDHLANLDQIIDFVMTRRGIETHRLELFLNFGIIK